MPIKFRCPHCRQFLGVSRTRAGALADCPSCGRTLRIPQIDGQVERVAVSQLNLNSQGLRQALETLAQLAQPRGQAGGVETFVDHEFEMPAPAPTPVPTLPPETVPVELTLPEVADTEADEKTVAAVLAALAAQGSSVESVEEDTVVEEVHSQTPVRLPAQPNLPPVGSADSVKVDINDGESRWPAPRHLLAILAELATSTEHADREGSVSADSHPGQQNGSTDVTLASEARLSGSTTFAGQVTGAGAQPVNSRRLVLPTALLLVVGAGLFLGVGILLGSSGILGLPPDLMVGAVPGREAPATSEVSIVQQPVDVRPGVSGRVHYIDASGQSRPDGGARIIVLPAERQGTALLPASAFRSGADPADRRIAEAALHALGGAFTVADESGEYIVELSSGSRYLVLILSHHLPLEHLGGHAADLLTAYVDRPGVLLGRVAWVLIPLHHPGIGRQKVDHTFAAPAGM